MEIIIKTSLRAYLVYLVLFSPVTIIGPILLAYQEKYLSSNFWQVHIVFVVICLAFLIYLYQEVHISKEGIILRKLSFSGTSTTKVKFNEVTTWSAENPIRFFIGSKEVMKINWVVFSGSDQKLLIDFILNKESFRPRAKF